jgi:hypothetical protein
MRLAGFCIAVQEFQEHWKITRWKKGEMLVFLFNVRRFYERFVYKYLFVLYMLRKIFTIREINSEGKITNTEENNELREYKTCQYSWNLLTQIFCY